jgi:poly(3-hydroxybutyrate) depolymerase
MAANAEQLELQEYKNGYFTSSVAGKIVNHATKYNDLDFKYYSYKSTENGNLDLYVFLHGEYSKSKEFFSSTGLHNELMRRGGFISIDAPASNWYESSSVREASVEFISKLILEYKKRLHYKNIYLIGYSHGGTLANEIMCKNNANENSKKRIIAGVVNIGGSIHGNNLKGCSVHLKKFPYLYVVGTKDDFYGYDSKNNRNKNFIQSPDDSLVLKESTEEIAKILRCKNPSEISLVDRDINDKTSIYKREYKCVEGAGNIYRVLKIANFGHNWFSNQKLKLKDFRGETNGDISINKYMFSFLKFKSR